MNFKRSVGVGLGTMLGFLGCNAIGGLGGDYTEPSCGTGACADSSTVDGGRTDGRRSDGASTDSARGHDVTMQRDAAPDTNKPPHDAMADQTKPTDAATDTGSDSQAGCVIGGVAYGIGATSPGSTCQTCQPATSTMGWTPAAVGTSCGVGRICNNGVCGAECDIGDAGIVASDAANPTNPCQSCQPGAATATWTSTAGLNASCSSGEVCNGSPATCTPGCWIGGTYYASGATMSSGCEVCSPATSTTAWTAATGAGSCASGQVCNGGSCAAGCSIGGFYFASGATSSGGCEICTPSSNTTAWTNADGKSCSGSGTCSSGSCAMPASCAAGGAGMTSCGQDVDSCCTSPEVTGGSYSRTYTHTGAIATGLADTAWVSGFRLDKYLVTVGRFRQFVNGGAGHLPALGAGKHTHLNGGQGMAGGAAGTYEPGWEATDSGNVAPTDANLACGASDTWTTTTGTQESLPINCVTWAESYAFCIWDGGFLPSEAEWEYAAAGGSWQGKYPWGVTDPGVANQYAIFNIYYTGNSTLIAPVGTAALGVARWGQLDLVGEVQEWNADWYWSYVNPCTDCGYFTPTSGRVARGTSFQGGGPGLFPATRASADPALRSSGTGFRCARTP